MVNDVCIVASEMVQGLRFDSYLPNHALGLAVTGLDLIGGTEVDGSGILSV